MTEDEALQEARQDTAFYETSGGGITLSGGEPMIQPAFVQAILVKAKAEGFHTAIETTCNVNWEVIEKILPVTDLFMMDIKHMDSEKHRAVTGVPNERILANARRLVETGKQVIFRVPVVPTVNDTVEAISAIAAFVASLVGPGSAMVKHIVSAGHDSNQHHPIETPDLELLPFHRMAGDKYHSLGLEYQAAALETPNKEKMSLLADAARLTGITVRVR